MPTPKDSRLSNFSAASAAPRFSGIGAVIASPLAPGGRQVAAAYSTLSPVVQAQKADGSFTNSAGIRSEPRGSIVLHRAQR